MKIILMAILTIMTAYYGPNDNTLSEALKTAKEFVTFVDVNDATNLEKILHPEMMQFAKIGDKLMPFKGKDFIKMVADKKLGGSPREITVKSVQVIREGAVDIHLRAVSKEYDFMYQISLAQEAGKWIVVTVLSEIKPVKA